MTTKKTFRQRQREEALASGLVVAKRPTIKKTPEEKREAARIRTREYHARMKAAAQAYRSQAVYDALKNR